HLTAGRRIHANVKLPILLATRKKFGSSTTREPPEKARKNEDDAHTGRLHESRGPRELVYALRRRRKQPEPSQPSPTDYTSFLSHLATSSRRLVVVPLPRHPGPTASRPIDR